MIVVVDNYDSFVHNLARYFEELGETTRIVRNDGAGADQLLELEPEAVVLSPGPGRPADAGISSVLVCRAPPRLPILGVCLGHQCIVEAFGGTVERAAIPVHGKLTALHHGQEDLFAGIPSPFLATRYHSLVVPPHGLPDVLVPLARTESGVLMAIRHEKRPVWGVQFHPEAVLTEHGHAIVANFLALARGERPLGVAAALPVSEINSGGVAGT